MIKVVFGLLTILCIGEYIFAQDKKINLNEVISIALKTQPELKSAEYEIQSYEKQRDIVNYDNLPLMAFGLNASQWKWLLPNKVKMLGEGLTDIYAEMRISQLIYNGGKVSLQSELADNFIRKLKLSYNAYSQKVILNVSKAYFEVLKAKKIISIYENSLERLKEHLRMAEFLYSIGKTSNLDVINAKVQKALMEEEIKKANNSVLSKLYALNNAIGWEIDKKIDIEDLTDRFFMLEETKTFNVAELKDEMFVSNPEFKKISLDYVVKDKELEINNSDYYPSIYAFGTMNWEDSKIRVPLRNNNWNVGISLTYNLPFLQGAKLREKKQQLEIMRDEIETNEEVLKKKYEMSLKTVLLRIEDLKSSILGNKKIIELAQESQKTAKLKYSVGIGNSLDVIDALLILRNSELNYSQNLIDFLIAIAELHYTIGRDGSAFLE